VLERLFAVQFHDLILSVNALVVRPVCRQFNQF
jgi:hypothetical protein